MSRLQRDRTRTFFIFASPWIIGTLLLTLFPLGFALGQSFTDWDGISPRYDWVGLSNYAAVLTDPSIWAALGRTALVALITVPIGLAGGLILAVLLDREIPARTALRGLIFLPSLIPPVAATLVWKLLFDRDTGPVNAVREAFGASVVDWLNSNQIFVVLILVMLWGVGGGIVINLAALQSVPTELLEAAEIDGANSFQRFWQVTVPTISPLLFFQLITMTIAAMEMFLPALLLSPVDGVSGVTGVPEANRVYMIEVYSRYFAFNQYGFASAMLWILFIVVLLLTAVVFRVSRRAVFYAVEPGKE